MPDRFKQQYRISSARLQGYDYGQNGAYFVTICTKNRGHYFGEIIAKETQNIASLRATPIGEIANEFWKKIPEHFSFVILDEFTIMPNHVHGIIVIDKNKLQNITSSETQNITGSETQNIAGSGTQNIASSETQNIAGSETQNIASLQGDYKNKFGPQSGNLPSIIRGYKAAVKSFATANNIEFGWQPRFHDRIIRNEDEMNRIRKYIVENPDNWFRDYNNKEDMFM
jgi:REP element-mobilizing transposase RayT